MTHIKSSFIDKKVSETVVEKNKQDRENHIPSGKLSASMLGKPLQSQILKVLGIPPKEVDEYVLRKFQRGKDVEEWLVKNIPDLVETQKEVEYRNVVGFIDAVVDTKNWEKDFGTIPLEVKSVTNMKYKNIEKTGEADRGHILQCCLYALSEGSEHFAITYVASDDYRINTMLYRTYDYATEVNGVIDRFDKQLACGAVPHFVPEEAWQSNPQYYDYPWAMKMTEEELNEYIHKNYPNIK